jgi:hypothetical protein
MSVERWLTDNVPNYYHSDTPPISISVDGVMVAPSCWPSTMIDDSNVVEIRPQPKGGVIVAVVAAVVAVAAAMMLAPRLPGQKNKSSTGSTIYEASARGNQPRLGDVIPEIAGRHKTYPDYLSAPRRYFVDKKTQALDLLLCVGKGDYYIADDDIRIGETPVSQLNIDYQVISPGEAVTGHVAHERWYNAPEVGGTTGGAGLRLKDATDYTSTLSAVVIELDGNTIRIPDSAGSWPADWAAGMHLNVSILSELVVIDGGRDDVTGAYLRDIIEGDLPEYQTGDTVTISGGSRVDADYLVDAYTPEQVTETETIPARLTLNRTDSTPEVWLPEGLYIASLDYTGISYRIDSIDAASATLTRLLPDGTPDPNWLGFGQSTTRDFKITLDSSSFDGAWLGPFLACPAGETVQRIEWDILAPQGLGKLFSDGNIGHRQYDVELQYREYGTTEWHSLTRGHVGNSRDQLGWTHSYYLPQAMTPEVRLRRIGAEPNDTQELSRLEWYGLRSELPGAAVRYPGVTVLAMTVTGSDTIAGQTENQVNLVATRKLPVRSGAGWTAPQATRDIAPWFAHIAHSLGYADSDIDMDELDRLDAIWRQRGDLFDYVTADDGTAKESLNRCLSAGMSELTIDGGRLRPVRDEPRTVFEHMYTPQNMLQPLRRSVSAPRPDDADGIDVEYFSADTWTKEVVECRLPGDAGIRPEKVKIEGVTSRARAWRIGMRRRRELKYRRWQYSFSTELDALNSQYMSFCAVADDVPGYGQSSLLQACHAVAGGFALTLSQPMTWDATADHVAAWRRPDGTLAGPFPATPGADDYQIIVSVSNEPAPSADLHQEPAHVLFGTSERWSYPVLIRSISPRGFESVSVNAVNYDERVYADDDGVPA